MDIFFDLLIIVVGTIAVVCSIVFFFFQLAFWHNKKHSGLYCLFFWVCGFIATNWIVKGSFDDGVPIWSALAVLGLLVQFCGFKEQWQEFQSDMFWEHSARGKIALLYLFLFLFSAGVRAIYYWQDNYQWLNSVPCVVTELQTKIGETEDSYDDGSPTGKMLATKELYLYARPLSSDTTRVKLRLVRVVAQNPSQPADELLISSFYEVGDTVNIYDDIIVGKP